MRSTPVLKYQAFLSYSHSDTKLARWLQNKLENYGFDRDLIGRQTEMGVVDRQLRPIFRDRDEFAPGDTLSNQTFAALDQSSALIVLCSPKAALSPYVNEEVRLFKSRYSERPVIPVIASGEPGHRQLECFPPAVRFDVTADGTVTATPVTTLAADLRPQGDTRDLALAKVVARLAGLGTDEIFRRAQRAQRLRQRQVIGMLTGVALAMGFLALWAYYERGVALIDLGVAIETADSLVTDVAERVGSLKSVKRETLIDILQTAERRFKAVSDLAPGDPRLLAKKVRLLTKLSMAYDTVG